jgi:hypothetical protein
VDRVKALVGQLAAGEVDKRKSNVVYALEWRNIEGEQGSAWVQSKAQLDRVVNILRSKDGMDVKIETHLIPREKSGLVAFLNQQQLRLAAPTATYRFQTGHNRLEP